MGVYAPVHYHHPTFTTHRLAQRRPCDDQFSRKVMPRARVTFESVRRLALALPGVEEGLSYGTPGFRVRGKFLARLWEDGETLVVKCGDDERDFRMQSDPETFYSTEHYRGYPTVLIRLASVKPSVLAEVLEQAWRRSAPKRLVAEFDRPG